MDDIRSKRSMTESRFTIRDLIAVAFRHRMLVIGSFCAIFLGGILAALLQPSVYESGMKVLVKRERVDPVVTAEASAQPQFAPGVTEEDLNSEVELLKSRDLLENVVIACDLQRSSGSILSRMLSRANRRSGSRTEIPIAKAVVALDKKLKVAVVNKTNLIAVTYESTDPELAARVLSSLTNLYLEKHLAVHRPPGAFDFFQQETQQYSKGLSDAEARLVDFSQGGSVVSAKLEKEETLQKLAEFEAVLKQTRATIAETKQRIRVLEGQTVSIPARMVTQVKNTDDAVLLSQLKANLLALELKRTDLLEKFEPSYRPLQEVETEIAQTRATLAKAEKTQIHEETTDRDPTHAWATEELAKANAELAGLNARAEATEQIVQSYRQNARALEEHEIVQDDLIRTVKATEENYLLYLRKEEEARISDALDRRRIINVAIAEAASIPLLPSNHRFLTALLGLLLAVFTSIALAFGAEYMDPTFRTPNELESFLDIPVLGTVSQQRKNVSPIPVL